MYEILEQRLEELFLNGIVKAWESGTCNGATSLNGVRGCWVVLTMGLITAFEAGGPVAIRENCRPLREGSCGVAKDPRWSKLLDQRLEVLFLNRTGLKTWATVACHGIPTLVDSAPWGVVVHCTIVIVKRLEESRLWVPSERWATKAFERCIH